MTLPDEKDNYDVWCPRCKKVHKYWTYTQQDHDRVIAQAAQRVADWIDAQAVEALSRER